MGSKHRADCPCEFVLRTKERDTQRRSQGSTAEERQSLGITTEEHAFVDIPHFHVSAPGPRDFMHTFLEGITPHKLAHTMWMLYHQGLATKEQIREVVNGFDYGGGACKLLRLVSRCVVGIGDW